MASTVCELLWVSCMLCDFCVPVSQPIPFLCDKKVAVHITANPVFNERTKQLTMIVTWCVIISNVVLLCFLTSLGLNSLHTSSPRPFLFLFFAQLLSKLGLNSSLRGDVEIMQKVQKQARCRVVAVVKEDEGDDVWHVI
ncbi:UNVERIFIED_CONTAM: hypothetical protein Sradi_0147800 [Sesamum radiatum]|uniref:Uncharacterized protein n=1 Tax=Sesamum radiatum TaxID=300843 RepID=A0AAW2WJP1_SESRA